MTGETVQFGKAQESAADKSREQSTISFPYMALDSAEEVAKAVYDRSGYGACDLDELAAEMGQVISGAFRQKTASARTFDVIDKDGRSTVKLTQLGKQIISEDTQRAARVEAFMHVPLYAAIFEKYRGQRLPPMKALEREMLSLGVSSKQTDRARQAFEKSAKIAGFFEAGDDRLVRPKVELQSGETLADTEGDKTKESHRETNKDEQHGAKRGSGGGGSGGGYHPFVQGLLEELPASEKFADWSVDDQAEWLIAAAGIFKLLSKQKGRISVKVIDAGNTNTAADQ